MNDTVTIQRTAIVEACFELPGEEERQPARIVYLRPEPDFDDGGMVLVECVDHPQFSLSLTGHELLAVVKFLAAEGWLRGHVQPKQAPAPPPAAEAAPEEAEAETDPPFPLPDLIPNSQSSACLDDPAWLRAMHHDHDLSVTDIARLCGSNMPLVKSRLTKHRIEYRSSRGRRARVPAA